MARVVTLANFRPAERADGQPWTKVRVEEVGDPSHEWDEVKAISLEEVDEDPAEPELRSFTVSVSKDWVRLVFVDAEDNEDAPQPHVYVPGPAFRPVGDDVAAIILARTYTGSGQDDDVMSVLTGGEMAGEFNSETRPTAETLDSRLIPQACIDVQREVGEVPGFLIGDARRITAIRAAAEAARSSYEPDGVTGGIYQTLRMTFEEQAETLRRRLQWWVVSGSLEG